MDAERWQAFGAEELRALVDALRWRASQLRTYLALAEATAGVPADEAEEGEDEAAELGHAHAALDLLERMLAEIPVE